MPKETLTILIVEDDLSFAMDLELLIQEIGYNALTTVDNSAEALEMILTDLPDLILMDIHIKGKLSGIGIAERIQHLNIPILFITSFGQETYYELAQQTNFIGYLVKPVNKYSLKSALDLALRNINQKEQLSKQKNSASNPIAYEKEVFPLKEFLFFRRKGTYYKVKVKDILYIEANDNYCFIFTHEGQYLVSQRINKMEDLMQEYTFARVHRGYIVNLKNIHSLRPSENILFIEKKKIPIGRSYKEEFIEKLKLIK